jgi:hypothetical protein
VAFKICIYLASINYLLAIRNDGDQMDFQEPKIIKQEKEDDSDWTSKSLPVITQFLCILVLTFSIFICVFLRPIK